MDTQDTRVTREEAAQAAGVSARTINRWRARGIISVEYGPPGTAAGYSLREVLAAAGKNPDTSP